MSAEPRRLAQLPGYDTAPDVYETADAQDTDATSTLGTQSTRNSAALLQGPNYGSETSESDTDSAEFIIGGEGEDDPSRRRTETHEHSTYGLSRRRLYPARARSRFGHASRGVDTAGADLSDRVDGRRRGYRVRRRRAQPDALDGDGEEESLPARLARLRREVEECRILAERETSEQQPDGAAQAAAPVTASSSAEAEDAIALSRLLARIEVPPTTARRTGGSGDAPLQHVDTVKSSEDGAHEGEDEDDSQTLRRISAFDARLAALEAALGISSLDAGGGGGGGPLSNSAPILPTLALLDTQLATLSSAGSLASLEAAGAKIQALQAEARNLTALQNAQTSSSAPASSSSATGKSGAGHPAAGFSRHTRNPSKGGPGGLNDNDSAAASEYGDAEEAPPLSPDDDDPDATILADDSSAAASRLTHSDVTQLRALYAQLPALQALGPTLPALLARLRSLRGVHGAAARAADDLAAVERRQEALDRELATWRAGLEKVLVAVREADAANGRNGTVVKEWVDGLERRIEGLGGGVTR